MIDEMQLNDEEKAVVRQLFKLSRDGFELVRTLIRWLSVPGGKASVQMSKVCATCGGRLGTGGVGRSDGGIDCKRCGKKTTEDPK